MKYDLPDYVISEGRVILVNDWRTPYGTIPATAESNGADVPRWLRWLVSPYGWLLVPSIFHDYYYKNALCSKKYADKVFRRIGRDIGIPCWFIGIAYLGVKFFGKGNY